jgi:hypothetical protein
MNMIKWNTIIDWDDAVNDGAEKWSSSQISEENKKDIELQKAGLKTFIQIPLFVWNDIAFQSVW